MNFLVIGETCNDKFIYGKVERICPEAPVPVFRPTRETNHLGMAANVLANLKAIAKSEQDDKNTFQLFTNNCKGSKTRYVDQVSNQMLIRVDNESYLSHKNLENINFKNYDAVLISDYNKGFLSSQDLGYIGSQTKHAITFLDTKKKFIASNAGWFNFIKINDKEYNENGFKSYREHLHNQLIVTKGAEGCMYRGRKFPCQATQVFDVSGAGDTFLAAFAYKYMHLKDVESSINFAQQCCAKVVAKKGVCTI